ncbi:protein kinase [Roseiconus nitratireducens]|uniref:Protein kinase n=2 Tax=Roseiconus nitratireducens TaxID=2605748 RepID=A0A5M6D8N0_9BACT|nr:protein kinase [Roseiconus nitratireducens]
MLRRGYEFAPGYRLQEFLGRGQFGQVWRASAPGGTAAAVKFIDLTGGQGQKEFEAVKRIKQIRQANLMPIVAIWLLDEQGRVIEDAPDEAIETIDITATAQFDRSDISMTPQRDAATLVVAMLLGGESLYDRMKQCVQDGQPGIPPRELLSFMEDAAKGLDFLNDARHDLGSGPVAIQHCDVKPANIVVLGNSAVICDFGLARILTRNQITATSASGTPAYMAPEAISGHPSQTSDQYSLAVTYYHLRTGSLPVADGTLYEVLEAHRRGDLSFSGLGPQEQAVLKRATQLDWQERFLSNGDFVSALRDALRAEGFPHAGQPSQPSGQSDQTNAPDQTGPLVATRHPAPAQSGQLDTEGVSLETRPGETRSEASGTAAVAAASAIAAKELPSKPDRRLPFWIGGLAVAALLVLATVILFAPEIGRQSDGSGQQETLETRQGEGPPAEASARELAESARNKFGQDPEAAETLFLKACSKDAAWAEPEKTTWVGHSDAVESVLITSNGSLVSIGYDQTPFLWPATSQRPSTRIPLQPPLPTPIYREAMTLVDSGASVLAAASSVLHYWPNIDAGVSEATVLGDFEDEVLAVAAHPSGHQVLVGSADQTATVVQCGDGKLSVVGRFSSIDVMKQWFFDPTGTWLVGLSETGNVSAYRWDEVTESIQANSAPEALSISADGARNRGLAFDPTATSTTVFLGDATGSISAWQITTPPNLIARAQPHRGTIEAICAAGPIVAAGDSDGWLTVQNKNLQPPANDLKLGNRPVSCLDATADGRWLAAGTYDGQVWLLKTSAPFKTAAVLPTGFPSVESVRIDAKRNRLIAGTAGGAICRWDLDWCQLVASTYPLPIAVDAPDARSPAGERDPPREDINSAVSVPSPAASHRIANR